MRRRRERWGGLCRLAGRLVGCAAAAVLATVPPPIEAAPPTAVTPATPGAAAAALPAALPAVSMAVSPAGELTIKLGDRVVASGPYALQVFAPAQLAADELPLGEVKVTVAPGGTPTHATVVHAYAAFEARYDLTLAGEDLTVLAHLKNNDAKRSLRKVNFFGPTFHFARNATGTLNSWHWTYLLHEGRKLFHPGTRNPVGCVFAADDAFAFSVHSVSEFSREDLFNASFQTDNIIPAECHVEFYTDRTIAPGGAADVDATFRISADRTIPHLLEKYKRAYAAHFPLLLYAPDARPVGQFAGADGSHVGPGNPLGYNGDWRRLDSGLGTAEYVRRVAPPFAAKDALGVIFWSPGGNDPPMYPPDFDVFPPSVQANVPALVKGFQKRHLRVGLCARCGDGIRRPPGKPPEVYRLSADNPDDMKQMLDRFRHAIDMGFDVFYLDSIGGTGLNDVRMIEQVRAAVGPDVLLYTEVSSDMTMPLAGRYCEWTAGGLLWTGPATLQCMQFLCPDSTWLCVSRTAEPIPKVVTDYGLTPLVGDMDAGVLPTPKPR